MVISYQFCIVTPGLLYCIYFQEFMISIKFFIKLKKYLDKFIATMIQKGS